MQRIIPTVLLVLLMTAAVLAGAPPDFRLKDLDGESFRLGDHLGKKVVYINFWASWCKPCKRELPHLQKLYEELGDEGFLPLAINTDPSAARNRVKSYVRRHGYGFPFLLDPDNNVHEKYNPTRKLPFSLLVDGDGQVHQSFSGYKTGDEVLLEKMVRQLLTKDESAAEEPTADGGVEPAEAADE